MVFFCLMGCQQQNSPGGVFFFIHQQQNPPRILIVATKQETETWSDVTTFDDSAAFRNVSLSLNLTWYHWVKEEEEQRRHKPPSSSADRERCTGATSSSGSPHSQSWGFPPEQAGFILSWRSGSQFQPDVVITVDQTSPVTLWRPTQGSRCCFNIYSPSLATDMWALPPGLTVIFQKHSTEAERHNNIFIFSNICLSFKLKHLNSDWQTKHKHHKTFPGNKKENF